MKIDFYLDKSFVDGKTEEETKQLRDVIREIKKAGKSIPEELLNSNDTTIYLYISIGKYRIKLNTLKKIYPKYWNFDVQQATRFYANSAVLNEYLTFIKSDLTKRYNAIVAETNTISISEFKGIAEDLLKGEQVTIHEGYDLVKIFEQFIEVKKSDKCTATVNKYKSLFNHLLKFQSEKKFKLCFEKMDLSFYERFKLFMIVNLKQTNNTVAKHTVMLRTFLRWAYERDYFRNDNFKKFKASNETVDIVALSEEELFRIYNIDLSHNKKLDQIRDVFCFGCFTGQRYSDIRGIKREDVKGTTWFLRTKKTRDILEVPLNEFAFEILEKYSNERKTLPVPSNQKMNEYLKQLGELVNINESITRVRYRGAVRIEETAPKSHFITTHTARRTFVTLSLEKGMRPETVMSITGHKDYKTMKRYIRINANVKKAEMNSVWNREGFLKAV